jgi:hypothetical protein
VSHGEDDAQRDGEEGGLHGRRHRHCGGNRHDTQTLSRQQV